MENTENKQMNRRGFHIMSEMPIWRALLKMAFPALIFMLVIGSYMFIDTILAINLVSKNYGGITGTRIDAKNAVRLSFSAFGPINPFLNAIAILFGMGIATRVSINKGAKKMDRAKNTLKTGMMIGVGVAIVIVPVLMFSMKPWMRTQLSSSISNQISNRAFNYGAIIIGMFPITMFNQILSSMFRTEGRNKAIMIPTIASVFINIFLDWIFMGVFKMDIEGGALATLISSLFVTIFYIVIIFRQKNSMITFKNMFGMHFKLISIVGIVLVGMSPFLRNLSSSITGSIEANVIKDISHTIYKGPDAENTMTIMLSGAFPIFLLFFPMMFAFAQAGRPIASFNYGAKNIKRVKETYMWVAIYATITAVIIYFVATFGVSGILLRWLGVGSKYKGDTIKMLKIMMLSILIFGLVISSMVLLGSTDRIWLSLLVSSLRGILLFFPFIYGFRELALNNPSNEFLFWWFFPAVAAASALIATTISIITLFHVDKKVKTLDERLNVIYKKLSRKKAK